MHFSLVECSLKASDQNSALRYHDNTTLDCKEACAAVDRSTIHAHMREGCHLTTHTHIHIFIYTQPPPEPGDAPHAAESQAYPPEDIDWDTTTAPPPHCG